MMQRFTEWLSHLRKPVGYAVRYVDPDGAHEVDVKDSRVCARSWARWCRRDGCTDVRIDPLYSSRQLATVMQEQADFVERRQPRET